MVDKRAWNNETDEYKEKTQYNEERIREKKTNEKIGNLMSDEYNRQSHDQRFSVFNWNNNKPLT